MKACRNPDCKESNPQSLGNFAKKKRYKDGIYSRCRSCILASTRAYAENNRDKLRKNDRTYYKKHTAKCCSKARLCRFRQKYWPLLGIREVEAIWNRMFNEQNAACSICKKPKRLEVEHCHKTGKVRSLACNGCNVALSRIEEDKTIAAALILYIEKHNE